MTAQGKFEDEEAIWRVWDALEGGGDAAFLPETGHLEEDRQTLVRLYTETAGLFARSLTPADVPEGLRERILEAVNSPQEPILLSAAPPSPATSDPLPGVVPSAPASPVLESGKLGEADPPAVATTPSIPPPRVRPVPVERPFSTGEIRRLRPSRWPLAMAATLALGFAGLAGYLWLQFEEQKAGVVRFENRIRVLEAQARESNALETQLAQARANLALVASRGVWACPLRPVGAARPGSHGMLFVAADHQHWMFSVEGLAPTPEQQEYQLWFLVGERPVSGGTFAVRDGNPVQLSSPTMPAGTTAVSITLEPRGGRPLPTTPPVLFGDRLIEVL